MLLRKFIYKIIIIILPLLIMLGTINYCIDPAHIFHHNFINKIANSLKEGKNIAGLTNYNSRLLQKKYIEISNKSNDVIVLGSSRSLQINQEMFNNKSFFNHSVTNSTIQDIFAIFNILEKNNQLPEQIILCTDQWLIGDSFEESRWLYLKRDYEEFLHKLGIQDISTKEYGNYYLQKEKIKELFSSKYCIESLNALMKKQTYCITDSIFEEKTMKLSDGSRMQPANELQRTNEEVEYEARKYFITTKDEKFDQINTNTVEVIEKFIEYTLKKNIHLTILIPPYHPLTHKLLTSNKESEIINKVDSIYKDWGNKYKIQIIGDTNPEKLGLTQHDFYDGIHLRRKTIQNIFNK